MTTTSTHDAWWTENRPGGVADPRNLISFPVDGKTYMYKSTHKVLPWEQSGAVDPNRASVPSSFVERWFKHAKVKDSAHLVGPDDRFLSKCLGIDEYLGDALDLLIEEAIFEVEDDNGDISYAEFEHFKERIMKL